MKLTIHDYGLPKGKGVIAGESIKKGEYIVSYPGEVITEKEAKKRQAKYEKRGDSHFYLFYTGYKKLVLDPTDLKEGIGRYLNHRRSGRGENIKPYKVKLKHAPYIEIRFKASRNIEQGEELFFDCGDRSLPF